MTQQENDYLKNQDNITREIQMKHEIIGEEQSQLIKLNNKERRTETEACLLKREKETLNKENLELDRQRNTMKNDLQSQRKDI